MMGRRENQSYKLNLIGLFLIIGPIKYSILRYSISYNMELKACVLECTLAEYFMITTFGFNRLSIKLLNQSDLAKTRKSNRAHK